MKLLIQLSALHVALGRLLDSLRSPFLLATRWYVAWQFWQSGWLKISSWDSTLELFRSEYHVPVLPPVIAAYAGTFGELFFPALLVLGLFSRIGALGTFAVNAMAVISYSAVLLAEGSEAALGQHVLWGIAGPGTFALDSLLERKVAARCRPQGVPTAIVAPTAR
jgi:putative oxidoreductase